MSRQDVIDLLHDFFNLLAVAAIVAAIACAALGFAPDINRKGPPPCENTNTTICTSAIN